MSQRCLRWGAPASLVLGRGLATFGPVWVRSTVWIRIKSGVHLAIVDQDISKAPSRLHFPAQGLVMGSPVSNSEEWPLTMLREPWLQRPVTPCKSLEWGLSMRTWADLAYEAIETVYMVTCPSYPTPLLPHPSGFTSHDTGHWPWELVALG